jgi:hypothetical protein
MRRIPRPESRNTLLCLAVLTQLLFASGLHAEKKWLRLTSPHFEMFTADAEKEARKGILHFETLQDLLTGPLGLPPSETPVTIIVLDSPKAFREFRPSGYPRATSVPGENRDLIVMSSLAVRPANPLRASTPALRSRLPPRRNCSQLPDIVYNAGRRTRKCCQGMSTCGSQLGLEVD